MIHLTEMLSSYQLNTNIFPQIMCYAIIDIDCAEDIADSALII